MAKPKSDAFFYMGSWYHRTKILNPDYTVRYSKKGGFASAAEARESYKRMLADFEKQKRGYPTTTQDGLALPEYLKYWLHMVYAPTVSTGTRMVYECILSNYILPNISHIPLKHCNTDYFDKLLAHISGYTKTSANKAREFLHLAFRSAVLDGFVERNPIDGTKYYPRDTPHITILNMTELRKLMEAVWRDTWELEVMLGLLCGLRKGEIYGLKFSDFDLEKSVITIERQLGTEYIFDEAGKVIGQHLVEKPPKTENSYRSFIVPQVVIDSLRRRQKQVDMNRERLGSAYHDHDYVSCQDNGEPHSMSALNAALTSACKKAGVPKVTAHDLRHMYATLRLEDGTSIEKLSALLGHSSIHTTFEHYCSVMDGRWQILNFFNKTFPCEGGK